LTPGKAFGVLLAVHSVDALQKVKMEKYKGLFLEDRVLLDNTNACSIEDDKTKKQSKKVRKRLTFLFPVSCLSG
jgi:hypothetical protein